MHSLTSGYSMGNNVNLLFVSMSKGSMPDEMFEMVSSRVQFQDDNSHSGRSTSPTKRSSRSAVDSTTGEVREFMDSGA
jgi:hypothetical protein